MHWFIWVILSIALVFVGGGLFLKASFEKSLKKGGKESPEHESFMGDASQIEIYECRKKYLREEGLDIEKPMCVFLQARFWVSEEAHETFYYLENPNVSFKRMNGLEGRSCGEYRFGKYTYHGVEMERYYETMQVVEYFSLFDVSHMLQIVVEAYDGPVTNNGINYDELVEKCPKPFTIVKSESIKSKPTIAKISIGGTWGGRWAKTFHKIDKDTYEEREDFVGTVSKTIVVYLQDTKQITTQMVLDGISSFAQLVEELQANKK